MRPLLSLSLSLSLPLALLCSCSEPEPVDTDTDTDVPVSLPDPVVHFSFDVCDPSSVDEAGTGLEASLVGNAECGAPNELGAALGGTWSSGTALDCDGDRDRAVVPHHTALTPAAFTLSAWTRVDEGDLCDGNVCTVLSKANSDASANGYWLLINTHVELTLSADGLETSVPGVTPLVSGTWHHVAATFDGEVAHVYLDGVLEGSAAVPGGIGYGDEPFLICAMFGRAGRYDFPGLVDEVKLWDEALDATRISDLFDGYVDG